MPTGAEPAYLSLKTEPDRPLTTLAEFLAWEEEQPERWERVGGVVRMMSGGTADHNTIALNLWSALRTRLAGRPCRPFVADLKVVCPSGESTYPDVVLVCPPSPGRAKLTEAPTLIAEVMSDSSERIDQNRKRWAYYAIPALRHYLIVDQLAPRVEVVTLQDGGKWTSEIVEDLDRSADLPALGLALPLAEIFAEVEFGPLSPAA